MKVKDELQDIILCNEQTGSDSQVKKARAFLRGYEKASLSIEKQQRFKDEETAAFINFVKESLLR